MVTKLYTGLLLAPLEQLATTVPNQTVLYTQHECLSALQLFNSSKNIAANLQQNGFKEGDTAVLAMEPGKEFLEVIYALLMLRARMAIVDPEMGRDNYAAKIKQLSPQWMFCDGRLLFLDEWFWLKKLITKFRSNLPEIDFKTPFRIIQTGRSLPIKKDHIPIRKLRALHANANEILTDAHDTDAENIIVYTSGTLDVPKGVLHTDKSLSTTIDLLRTIISGKSSDIVGTYLPHFMLLGVASGLAVKIMSMHMSPKAKLNWMATEKIAIMFGPPSEFLPLIIYCEQHKTSFPDSLRHLMLGSAPVHQGFLKRLIRVLNDEVRITCTYGMTEHLLVAVADGREKINYSGEGDLLGKIIPGVDVTIADDNEIMVRSEQLFGRYLHLDSRPEWHATGDLGELNEDSNLVLLGRKKEMIIRKDFNIYPALYEGTIKKIPGINESVFVGIYDESLHDEKVYLAISSDGISPGALRKMLQHGAYSIDRQAIPDVILEMSIPRKGRQDKIDRSRIVEYILKNGL